MASRKREDDVGPVPNHSQRRRTSDGKGDSLFGVDHDKRIRILSPGVAVLNQMPWYQRMPSTPQGLQQLAEEVKPLWEKLAEQGSAPRAHGAAAAFSREARHEAAVRMLKNHECILRDLTVSPAALNLATPPAPASSIHAPCVCCHHRTHRRRTRSSVAS